MRDVKLVRLSDDGTHLVLTHERTGEEFALRVDDRLRGAVVSDRARQGALPLERQSRLRPKEIQARLRAGESSEDIAAAADVPIERILRYAGPVLAEREYIAEQARRCALRRNGRDGPGQILDEAVGKRLDELQVGRDHASWDAWRSSEGRWVVAVSFGLGGTDHKATFRYDPLGRVVTSADDIARALVGEATQPVPGLTPELAPGFGPSPDDADERHRSATGRSTRDGHRLRLAPVPSPDPGVTPAEPALELPETEDTIDLSQTLAARGSGPKPQPGRNTSGEHRPDAGPPTPDSGELAPDEMPDLDDPLNSERVEEPAVASRAEPAPPPAAERSNGSEQATPRRARSTAEARRKRARSSGRRGSVPSWDDILFGGGGREAKD
ncbi:septation protein SepH [Actinopolymorpha sp. B11F2]|uniref:septation protein SepH n=1 Tax=Actinopolymorpha sp. B11F2 TaxID=3160862 RepID=UPI0032E3BC2E